MLAAGSGCGGSGVSIRKCCQRAFRWPAWRLSSAAPVMALQSRVLIRAGRLGPGPAVSGLAFQGRTVRASSR
jgi:hypothetical protein